LKGLDRKEEVVFVLRDMGLWSEIDAGRWVRENLGWRGTQSREAKPLSNLSLIVA
jgi:hypothetical protein